MLNEEIRLHNLYDVGKNPNYYNKSKQTSKSFSMNGWVNVKDKDGNILSVSVDDPRYLSGELISIATNKVSVKDKDGNKLYIDKENYDHIYMNFILKEN